MSLVFRQLFDPRSWTYTYLLADSDSREAVLIDGVLEQQERDRALIRELDLKLIYTLETHVHADHITSAAVMRHTVGSRTVVAEVAAVEGVDLPVVDGDKIFFGSHAIRVLATPGHTDGCVTYVLDGQRMAFTGDALLVRGAGRTDFQQGDPAQLFHSVRDRIFSLPARCALYPGHDYAGRTVTTVEEERRYNPRLCDGTQLEDFVGYMKHLGLAHPRQIDVAVPANMVCGNTEEAMASCQPPAWGPVQRSYAGVWEIDAEWVARHRDQVTVVDVREASELEVMPPIDGALRIPLGELATRVDTLPAELPVVVVCQSGARSARAASMLEAGGISQVANIIGGMLRWRDLVGSGAAAS